MAIAVIGTPDTESLTAGAFGCLIGIGFIFYGAKHTPHEFNPFNVRKKPLPVWLARCIFFPLGVICIFFGLRDLIRVLRQT